MIIIGRFSIFVGVFLEVADQASEHQTVSQVQHCFLVLTFGIVVEAIRSPHHSHDPRFDRGPGILAQPLGQALTIRDM